jgi:hypothetical protein
MLRKKDVDTGSESVPVVKKRVDGIISTKSDVEVVRIDQPSITSDIKDVENEMTEEERKRSFEEALEEGLVKYKDVLDKLAKH